jgi:hypothetical protein
MRAFPSELLSESDATLVHEARVPSGRRSQTRWKDTDAIRTSKSGRSICVANAGEVESGDASNLSDTGRAWLPVSTRDDSNLLVRCQLGHEVLCLFIGDLPC